MAAAERRLSRSLSLDALQARVDAKRQRNKKPKEKYLKALEQRRVAEGVTLDFVELSDAGELARNGAVLTDTLRGQTLTVRQLSELELDVVYKTQRGSLLRRVGAARALLAEKAWLRVDTEAIVPSTSLSTFLWQPERDVAAEAAAAAAAELSLGSDASSGGEAAHADEKADDAAPSGEGDGAAYARRVLGRLARFLSTRLGELRQKHNREAFEQGRSVAASAHFTLGDAAAAAAAAAAAPSPRIGARLVAAHCEDAAAALRALEAPADATYAVSVYLSVASAARDFKVGSFSGALKAVVDFAAPQIAAALPAYRGYKTALVRDAATGARRLRVSVFLGGELEATAATLSLLRRLDLSFDIARVLEQRPPAEQQQPQPQPQPQQPQPPQQPEPQPEQPQPPPPSEQPAAVAADAKAAGGANGSSDDAPVEVLPPLELLVLSLKAEAEVDELLVDLARRVGEGLLSARVGEWLGLLRSLRDASLRVAFKSARELLQDETLGPALRASYAQTAEMVNSLAASGMDKLREVVAHALETVSKASRAQVAQLYNKFRASAVGCFEGVESLEVQYASLRATLAFRALPVFEWLPDDRQVAEAQEQRRQRAAALARAEASEQEHGDLRRLFRDEDFTRAVLLCEEDANAAPGWERVSNQLHTQVWLKRLPNPNEPYLLKVQGVLEGVGFEEAFRGLYDVQLRNTWDTYITDHRVLESLPPAGAAASSEVIYTRWWVPPGVDHREFVEFRSCKRFPKGAVVVAKSCHHPAAPKRKGHTLGHTFTCLYYMRELEAGARRGVAGPTTLFTVYSQMDYGGFIPRALINFMNRQAISNWMELFISTCTSRLKHEVTAKGH